MIMLPRQSPTIVPASLYLTGFSYFCRAFFAGSTRAPDLLGEVVVMTSHVGEQRYLNVLITCSDKDGESVLLNRRKNTTVSGEDSQTSTAVMNKLL
jgi:hypothetical protein